MALKGQPSNVVNQQQPPHPPECIEVSEAIRAQGIDDLTSSAPVQCCIAVVYSCLLLLGLLGNGSVLLAFAQSRRLRSTRNLFLLNLILTDILLCLTAVPVTPWYALTKDWSFGPLMCHLVPLSNSCAVFVTSWSLCAIALDKFLHIVDPTRGQFSLRTAATITFVIWTLSSLLNIPYLLSYRLVNGDYYVPKNATPFCGQFCDELNWPDEAQRRLYGTGVMLFQFVVPMTIITYCYWRILHKVHKDMIVQNAQFSQSLSNSQRTDALNRKKRVNYILIGMVIAFIGCNTPITAVNLLKDFKREPLWLKQQPYLWPLVAHVIAMSAVVWNPFLFFWLTAKDKQKGAHLTGIATATSEIITSLVSRMHSLRSSNGAASAAAAIAEEAAITARQKRRSADRKTAAGIGGTTKRLQRTESEATGSSGSKRPLVGSSGAASGLSPTDSIRLWSGTPVSDAQQQQHWVQMRPLVVMHQNGQQMTMMGGGAKESHGNGGNGNGSNGNGGGRRSPLLKAASLGVNAL